MLQVLIQWPISTAYAIIRNEKFPEVSKFSEILYRPVLVPDFFFLKQILMLKSWFGWLC